MDVTQEQKKLLRMATGNRGLLDAKIAEFQHFTDMGFDKSGDDCRETAHTLLDTWLDAYVELSKSFRAAMS